ncbi:MAG: hypothetical protein OXT64_02325 [Gammaproteobacteria bacterium]|nr:hypothetical protein [Gammaproteobacteria bacterium]MDE0239372.1 hypothetical protein [bacterium]
MKILFDHGTPAPLRHHLQEHIVDRSAEKGWELMENGELIREAEEEGYGVIVTTDQNIRHQQNLTDVRLAIVVLLSPAWPRVQHRTAEIRQAIEEVGPGELLEVPI